MAGLLGIGQSALMAAYAQLQTTGHNIANANTPGYSRQDAVFATAGGTYTGGGFLGMGVDLVTVQRSYDRFLTGELASSTSASASDSARAAYLERLQRVFGDTDNGIGAAIDDLNTALADVANRASDPTAREIVLRRAETLAQRIRNADSQLRALGRDVDEQIGNAAERVTDLLSQYAGLNERISAAQASGHAPNDLLDERDRVLLQLNGYMKVTAQAQDDGTVNLFAAGGEGLLVGSRAAKLEVRADTGDGSVQRIVLKNGAAELPMSAASFGGGSIGGWMRFRDEDVRDTRKALYELADDIATSYNDRQKHGVDASGEEGSPMFACKAPTLAGEELEFRSLLVSGRELAAAFPVTPQLGQSNGGAVSIAAFDVTDEVTSHPVQIVFEANAQYSVRDASGVVLGAGSYASGEPIEFEGWSLTFRGTPAVGDTLDIVTNANPGTDGRNARAMILDSESASAAAPGSGPERRSLTDSFATLLGNVGARTQSAQASRTSSAGLLSNAQAAQAEHSAVNLDEEAARLMQYQQMYQAAAKVIQAAQSMFDSLLAATAR